MNYLFFDLETGGMDSKTHTILTGYFCILNENKEYVDELELSLKLDNGKVVAEDQALKITGINVLEHLNSEKTITYTEGKKKLLEFLTKHKIKGKRKHYRPSGQNIEFDLRFLFDQLEIEEDWKKMVDYKTLDSLRITTFLQDIQMLPSDIGNLESLVDYFNLPKGTTHNAKEDVKMTIEVYKALSNMVLQGRVNSTVSDLGLLNIIEER